MVKITDKTFNNEHNYATCLSSLQRRRVVFTNDAGCRVC